MPSYAAIQCANQCGESVSHAGTCCKAGTAASNHQTPDNTKHTGDHQPCVLPCCGYVANVQVDHAARAAFEVLAAMLPMTPAVHDSLSQGAIFHPPRA